MRCLFPLVLIVMLAAGAEGAWCCVGARPLGMGGAFVAVADDVHATYWNPAGLIQLAPGALECTLMHTATNRDDINYQEYSAVASGPPKFSRQPGKVGWGVSFVANRRVFEDRTNDLLVEDDELWMWLSGAVGLGPLGSIGINARLIADHAPKAYDIATDPAVDVGYMLKLTDMVRLGLLVQDVNQPWKTSHGVPFARYTRNFRPGVAVTPLPNLILAAEGYDMTNDGGSRSYRVGAELDLGSVALRGGYYGFGGSGSPRAVTGGLGVKDRQGSVDLAIMSGDLDNTVILSGSFRLE